MRKTTIAAVLAAATLTLGLTACDDSGKTTATTASTVTATTTVDNTADAVAPITTPLPDTPDPTSIDDMFVQVVREKGINASDSYIVATGHQVCDVLGEGTDVYTVAQAIATNSGEITLSESAYFVGASIGAYCPQYEYMTK